MYIYMEQSTCTSYMSTLLPPAQQYVIRTHHQFCNSSSSDRKPRPEETFSEFFGKWMSGLQDYPPLLLYASTDTCLGPPEDQDRHLQAVIVKLTAHHKQYYTEKWAAAEMDKGGNVFLYLYPPWMTPLERAYSWMMGWKPLTAFKLVGTLRPGPGLSPFSRPFGEVAEEQAKGMERLRLRTRHEEDKVERDMERQQVEMEDRKMVELARMASTEGTAGEADRMVEAAIFELSAGMERAPSRSSVNSFSKTVEGGKRQ